MKSILYGTTALMAVGLMAGTAVAAEKIKLGLGGYWRGAVHLGGDDFAAAGTANSDNRDHGFGQESEIYFSGKTTLDNGIKFGVMVQLEGETSADQMDNSYIWSESSFGRIEFGETWGPSLLMSYGTIGEKLDGHGDFGSHTTLTNPNGLNINSYGGGAGMLSTPEQKMNYFTPRMAGFQLGVGYIPENNPGGNTTGSGINNSERDGLIGSELFDIGANYIGKFGGVDVAAFGSYFTSETEPALAVGSVAAEDVDGYSVGGQVGFAGFRVGGRYVNLEDLNGRGNDEYQWRVGVEYGQGPWSVGAVYQLANADIAGAGRDDETEYVSVGGAYNLGPGVKLFGGVQLWDFEDSSGANTSEGDAAVGVLGTKLSF